MFSKSQSDKLCERTLSGFQLITKEDLPAGFRTDSDEQGLKARFHPSGNLAEYGYYWQGGAPACGWVLHLGDNDAMARVMRCKRFLFPEDEEDRFDADSPDDVERAWTEWLDGWLDSIVEKAHTPLTCSFCNRGKEEVARLIAGPVAMICDRCIKFCQDLVAEDGGRVSESEETD